MIGVLAFALTDSGFNEVTGHWYRGFWMLEFGMQLVLILTIGYAIALSPIAARVVDRLTGVARTPGAIYMLVLVAGGLFSMVSWGWVVLAAVLARELAQRVGGVDYAYLVACVYLSSHPSVAGLSSSIPLFLNPDGNFLIESGVLSQTVPASATFGSWMNAAYVALYFLAVPLLKWFMRPAAGAIRTPDELRHRDREADISVAVEAEGYRLGGGSVCRDASVELRAHGVFECVRLCSQRGGPGIQRHSGMRSRSCGYLLA